MQVCILLQTDNNASTPSLSFFNDRMPFLPPNQQRQSTEGIMQQQWTQKPLRRQARRHRRTTMSMRLLPRSRDWSRVSDPRECGKNRIRLSRSSSSSRLTRLTTHKTHYFNLDAQNQSKCQVRCGLR